MLWLYFVERFTNGVSFNKVLVVDKAIEPITLEVPLDLRKASLNRVTVREIRYVVQRCDVESRVHLLHDVGFVGTQIVHEQGKRLLVVRTAQIPEVTAEVERVDGTVLDVYQLDSVSLRHGRDHCPVAGVHFCLVHLQIGVPTTPFQWLHGGFRENSLVHVPNGQLFRFYFGQLPEKSLLPITVANQLVLWYNFSQHHPLPLYSVPQI